MNTTESPGRKRIWLADYRYTNHLMSEAEAISLATSQALHEVPEASVEIRRVRQTPTGRWVVTMRRVRGEQE